MRALMCLSTVVFLIGCATQSSKSTEDSVAAVDTARLMSSDEDGEAKRGRLESSLSASKVAVGEAFYLEERFSNEGNKKCSILSTGVYSALERFCEESGDWEQVDIDPETLTCDPGSGVAVLSHGLNVPLPASTRLKILPWRGLSGVSSLVLHTFRSSRGKHFL